QDGLMFLLHVLQSSEDWLAERAYRELTRRFGRELEPLPDGLLARRKWAEALLDAPAGMR
ncbi:MAG: hypothetical protein KDB61_09925, partial [Planctomycetes bacterium]|nr:hypothetical protein [Planctomycetota bacterium]